MIISKGNISLNTEGFKGASKEAFLDTFKGKTTVDLHALWDEVQSHLNGAEEALIMKIDAPLEKKKKKKKKFFSED